MSIGRDKEAQTVGNTKMIANMALESTNDVIPLVYGISVEDLKQGAGYYPQSSWPGEKGSCIIIGHRETFFKNLGELGQNDRVTIEIEEKKFVYRVCETTIIDKIDGCLMKQKDKCLLLLITCYPIKLLSPIEKRYLVMAEIEG